MPAEKTNLQSLKDEGPDARGEQMVTILEKGFDSLSQSALNDVAKLATAELRALTPSEV